MDARYATRGDTCRLCVRLLLTAVVLAVADGCEWDRRSPQPDVSASPAAYARLAAAGGAAAGSGGRRPAGVSECYTDASSAHPATLAFWRVFASSDYAARSGLIEQLQAAAQAQPEDEQLTFLHAQARLWRAAEPQGLADLLAAPEGTELADKALTRAYELCPTDHRIPAWLGPLKVIIGRLTLDDARISQGIAVVERGAQLYPAFVTFAFVMVYGGSDPKSAEFAKAVAAARRTLELGTSYCPSMPEDPSCIDSAHVPHNIEGTVLYLGDVFARAQDRQAALTAYEMAKAVPGWADWPYKALLEERIGTLDARMAAAATPSVLDDYESAWDAADQCALCHRQ